MYVYLFPSLSLIFSLVRQRALFPFISLLEQFLLLYFNCSRKRFCSRCFNGRNLPIFVFLWPIHIHEIRATILKRNYFKTRLVFYLFVFLLAYRISAALCTVWPFIYDYCCTHSQTTILPQHWNCDFCSSNSWLSFSPTFDSILNISIVLFVSTNYLSPNRIR